MAPAAGRAHRDPRGAQVAARRLATDAGGLLDPPQRPAEAAKGQNLLSFLVAQDVRHGGGDRSSHAAVNVLGVQPLWPVFRCPSMAAFGCPPRERTNLSTARANSEASS